MDDPRKDDLAADSALWTRLLAFAAQSSPALTEPLLTMRQGGTVLKRLDTGGNAAYALRPLINKRCWKNEAAYKAKAAELLRPHHDQLVELLQNFAAQLNAALSSGTQGDRIRAHLDINGYCAIKSGVLDGEVIWFVRDAKAAESSRAAKMVPQDATCYTLDELQTLVANPQAELRSATDDLRKLHFAKKTFNGTILREGIQ
ncbi:MAG: hypothetical protein QME74_10405 [Candidatus Edwardsbacteria bacterium]|nr:hypothetical protein [Candidatus Edwardsbacteria bacterium]